jgi:hypothetical protein
MATDAAESSVGLLGSVAEETIHHSSVPVLVVRPPQASLSADETPSEGTGSEVAAGPLLETGGTMARRKSRSELRARQARHRRRASGATVQTLPLFGGKLSELPSGQSASLRRFSTPMELALHIYWSAGVEAHALGALALQTVYPDQRRALLQLQGLEERRKALAARLLEQVWRVTLQRSSEGMAADPGNGQAA